MFCLKCKVNTESTNIKKEQTKNKRWILKAICVVCGCKNAKFIKKDVEVEGGDIVDVIGKHIDEMHFPGSNYLGPGTKFKERIEKGDKPVDRIDEASMHHDLSYHMYKDKEKRHEADRKLLKDIDSIQNPTFKEKLKGLTTKAVIKPKLFLGLGLDE